MKIKHSLTYYNLFPQEELVSALELDYEIQSKITTAALKLANDATLKKVRKQRKLSYQMSAQKLRDIETRLKAAKAKQLKRQQQKMPRPSSDGEGERGTRRAHRAAGRGTGDVGGRMGS